MWGLVQTPPPPRAPESPPDRVAGTDRLGGGLGLEWDQSGPAPSLGDHVKDLSPLSVCFLICQTEIRPLTETFQPDKVMYNVG